VTTFKHTPGNLYSDFYTRQLPNAADDRDKSALSKMTFMTRPWCGVSQMMKPHKQRLFAPAVVANPRDSAAIAPVCA
jgi:hypothetical protein